MRLLRIEIDHWRNLRQVDITIAPDANLVCLVGENGTGKSGMLELVSSLAHQAGITAGIEFARGDPLDEPHKLRAEIVLPAADVPFSQGMKDFAGDAIGTWDGSCELVSEKLAGMPRTSAVKALNLDSPMAPSIAQEAINFLRNKEAIYFLYLDSDRAYPPVTIPAHEMAALRQMEWDNVNISKQYSYRPTRTLYEEWQKYMQGYDEQISTRYVTSVRRAAADGDPAPVFEDPFLPYRDAILSVLPHLRFVGLEESGATRSLLFDSGTVTIPFRHLSGGEREVAFLLGQVDRFGLESGLLLIDEPELHLNPDLVRVWVSHLRETIVDGQVWVATHSLEAVEAAGPEATFVFERDDSQSRIVTDPKPLIDRKIVSVLSRAVGSPAFSLAGLRFIFIEGQGGNRERSRFMEICAEPAKNRFIEGGNCETVLKRLDLIDALARETDDALHLGAVIDRDFRDDAEVDAIRERGAYVLDCHEVENLYLSPDGIAILLERSGKAAEGAADLVRSSSDRFAGLWVAQYASAQFHANNLNVEKPSMTAMAPLTFSQLDADWATLSEVSTQASADPPVWRQAMDEAWAAYQQMRGEPDLWMRCLGKQVLGSIAGDVGASSTVVLERQILRLWETGECAPPDPVIALRTYVQGL